MLVWIRDVQRLAMLGVFCDGLVYVQLPYERDGVASLRAWLRYKARLEAAL